MTGLLHTIPSWIQLISLTFCIGAIVCRLWVLDDQAVAVSSPESMLRRLQRLIRISIAAIIACAIADLLIGAAEMSGSADFDVVSLLPTVILKTHFGRVWMIRIFSLLLLLVAAGVRRGHRESHGGLYLMLVLGFVAALTESASGHASDKGDLSLAEIMDFFHLLAASVWGGGLFTLSIIILPALSTTSERAVLAKVATKFSRIAGYSVGIIALTSLYNVWTYVGNAGPAWKSPYGLTALAKIILFLCLIWLGALNRYIIIPFLQEGAGSSPKKSSIGNRLVNKLLVRVASSRDEKQIAHNFIRNVRIEAVLVAAALLCAALLRHEVPARHAVHIAHANKAGHEAHMHYAPHPEVAIVRLETLPAVITGGVPVSITVHLEDRKGKPLQGLREHHERILHAVIIGRDLNVFAHIHPEDLGALTNEMLNTATFSLRFTFPQAGDYLIGFDFADADGLYSKTVLLHINGRPNMAAPIFDFSRTKDFGSYRIILETVPKEIKSGEKTTLHYMIEKNGKPVTDLEPYLGAAMHLAVVSSDLKQFIHAHGDVAGGPGADAEHEHAALPERFGPQIESTVVFPKKGVYQIFSQVQSPGKVLLFDFMVTVK
ncbi:MAG TPA: CopD family protein [Dissulfurispiraceae bacterium]|nr:CopD family protein [Dissulfurispiraceae bacterium]